jgi:hypothetical protein
MLREYMPIIPTHCSSDIWRPTGLGGGHAESVDEEFVSEAEIIYWRAASKHSHK